MVRDSLQSGAVLGDCFWFAVYIRPPALLQEAGRKNIRGTVRRM